MTLAAVVCVVAAVLVCTGTRPSVRRLDQILGRSARASGPVRDVLSGRPRAPTHHRGADRRDDGASQRGDAGRPVRPAGRAPARPRLSGRGAKGAAAVAVGAAGWLVVAGTPGAVLGVLLAVGGWLGLTRLVSGRDTDRRDRFVGALPLTAELLGEAMTAGCPPQMAADIVGRAIGGPLGQALAQGAIELSVGTDPADAWASLASEPAARPLARALAGATTRGAAVGGVLRRAAADGRETLRWEAEMKARSVGARAAAPLGLCFLPAFILLGVVPIVATSGWFPA